MISIIIPTRSRPNNVIRLIESLHNTANVDNLQIILRIDDDDVSYDDLQLSCDIVKKPRNKFLSDLWQEAVPEAKHDIVMACADDVIFRTKNWDQTIINIMKDPVNTLCFLWCNDLYQGPRLATLPFVTRAWINAVGFLMPSGYARDWCDTHLHDIARKLRKLGAEAMVYLKDVVIEHMHPAAGKSNYDETYTYRLKMSCPQRIFDGRDSERHELSLKIFKEISAGKYKLPIKPV